VCLFIASDLIVLDIHYTGHTCNHRIIV